MKVLFLLAALLVGGSVADARPKHDPHSTTLRLEFSDSGVCSGTVVGRQTVLTATHCFDGGGELRKINGRLAHVIRKEDDGKDHSLLVVSIVFDRIARIGGTLKQGDEVEFWGNPAGIPDQYRRGVVSGALEGVYFVDASTWKGDSGAGIFKDGAVAGVVSGVIERGQFGLTAGHPLAFTPKQLAEIK